MQQLHLLTSVPTSCVGLALLSLTNSSVLGQVCFTPLLAWNHILALALQQSDEATAKLAEALTEFWINMIRATVLLFLLTDGLLSAQGQSCPAFSIPSKCQSLSSTLR